MRSLITGGHGFVGRHLAEHVVKCGDDVAVTYQPEAEQSNASLDPFAHPLPKTAQSMALDVSDRKGTFDLIQLLKPDTIYHLAAKTFVPDAERNPKEVFDVNLFGTLNLLDAVKEHCPAAKVLFVSSAEVYGEPKPGALPLTEEAPLRPVSVYGVAKAAADVAAFKYSRNEQLNTVRVRPFPHVGPGQNSHFAISSFARQCAEIKLGRRDPIIRVGNLEARRDYSDVSDIVRGYREALLNGTRGEVYNLCSGQSVEIGDLLQRLIAVAEVEVEVVVDEERLRPIDIPESYGDYSRAQRAFGWKPRIELEATLHSIFAFWVERLAAEGK